MIALKIKNNLFFVVAGLIFFSLSYMIAAEDEKPLCFLLAEENRKINLEMTQSQPDIFPVFKKKFDASLIFLNSICEELKSIFEDLNIKNNNDYVSQELVFLTWRASVKKDRRAINDLFDLLKMKDQNVETAIPLACKAILDRLFTSRAAVSDGSFMRRAAAVVGLVTGGAMQEKNDFEQEKNDFEAFIKREGSIKTLWKEFLKFCIYVTLIKEYINPEVKMILTKTNVDCDKGIRRSLRWMLKDLDKHGKVFSDVLRGDLKLNNICHDGLQKSYAFWGTSDFDYKEYEQAIYQHALINWLLTQKESYIIARMIFSISRE